MAMSKEELEECVQIYFGCTLEQFLEILGLCLTDNLVVTGDPEVGPLTVTHTEVDGDEVVFEVDVASVVDNGDNTGTVTVNGTSCVFAKGPLEPLVVTQDGVELGTYDPHTGATIEVPPAPEPEPLVITMGGVEVGTYDPLTGATIDIPDHPDHEPLVITIGGVEVGTYDPLVGNTIDIPDHPTHGLLTITQGGATVGTFDPLADSTIEIPAGGATPSFIYEAFDPVKHTGTVPSGTDPVSIPISGGGDSTLEVTPSAQGTTPGSGLQTHTPASGAPVTNWAITPDPVHTFAPAGTFSVDGLAEGTILTQSDPVDFVVDKTGVRTELRTEYGLQKIGFFGDQIATRPVYRIDGGPWIDITDGGGDQLAGDNAAGSNEGEYPFSDTAWTDPLSAGTHTVEFGVKLHRNTAVAGSTFQVGRLDGHAINYRFI